MTKMFFTSDLHLGHDKEFIYKPRGFNTVKEHDAAIIERWNKVVNREDTVYILGDLIMNDQEAGIEKLKQLNGKKIMIYGNHDTTNKVAKYRSIGIKDLGYASVFRYKNIDFYLSHYPTLTDYFYYNSSIKNSIINLHGHTHKKETFGQIVNPFIYNVALDAHDCAPVDIEQIILDIKRECERYREIIDKINEVKN